MRSRDAHFYYEGPHTYDFDIQHKSPTAISNFFYGWAGQCILNILNPSPAKIS